MELATAQEINCPEWCTAHFGGNGHSEALAGEKYLPGVIGKHTALLLKERRYDFSPCSAVRVEQSETLDGRSLPKIEFWHGNPYVRNLPASEVPRAPQTHHPITALEARRLAEALLKAAEMIEALLPGRCGCGEPVALVGAECEQCSVRREIAEEKAARPVLRVV